MVNLGILAQKSDFCLKLEEGLVNNKCKLNYRIFYQVSSAYFTFYEEKLCEILANYSVAEKKIVKTKRIETWVLLWSNFNLCIVILNEWY